ncbi:MAG: efflux RND transporter periplasmic adaptor subunit [Capsulimonadaceae bacterium]|nr:efflux RND transporter periplasmic adaptor subunit [Capsulimonadaceae bacterium]
MIRVIVRNVVILVLTVAVIVTVSIVVHKFKRPGQMDVVAAQSMDMSSLKPPTGVAHVELWPVRKEALSSVVTYTGTVKAYNEQEIDARITGRVVELPVYPGDTVKAGQIVVRLDTAEVDAKADQASAEALQAAIAAHAAHLTEHIHHMAAFKQASAQRDAAVHGLADAESSEQNARDAIDEANGAVSSARSSRDYWTAELAREKRLADAGAVSLQEYQSELSQAQAADAQFVQAQAKAREAVSASKAAGARVAQARSEVNAASAAQQMAEADTIIGDAQTRQAQAGAAASNAAAREARVVAGYSTIAAPLAGAVSERPISPGTLVQPGAVLLRIAQIDKVRVQANVAVADVSGIAVGSPVTIAVQGVPALQALPGNVTSIFPSADPKTHTDTVEAVVANPSHHLFPGAFVSMRIAKQPSAPSLIVPTEAIRTLGGSPTIWIAQPRTAAADASQYECEKCHMRYSAADAKRYNYVHPMDGGRLLPVASAAPAQKVTASQYECEKCHMRYSAADAKRYNFVDPMDGGKLLPVSEPASPSLTYTAHQVTVTPGASDGPRTAVSSDDLHPGDLVIRRFVSGIYEGATVSEGQ